ncbi:hypothetical protein [Rhizobium sp. 1399]|uniref:hypothetical protein n=1 Tax=Rhizobium sp. 1399 TaxID=2817758 RepID=UPI00285BB84A|nr:hypothetical protein [Rhizobium sp. 1399]MDR6666779.1 hypothetical protein [Rhizobium sp. 1399]
MIGISQTFHARFRGEYALQLLQTASINNGGGKHEPGVFAQVGVTAAGANGGAIDSIMRIIMDAKGNAGVLINSPGGTASVTTGNGNDVVDITANEVNKVSTGRGDDVINIRAGGQGQEQTSNPSVAHINSGRGHDSISITSGGNVAWVDGGGGDDQISIETTADVSGPLGTIENLVKGIGSTGGGKGDDTIVLESTTSVRSTDGDDGNDTINISSAAFAFSTAGGKGDDAITVSSRNVFSVDGGSGDDLIEVTAVNASGIDGGDGNDVISVNATAAAYNISGGKGDDYVVINSTSTVQSTYHFAEGDGHDIIETNNPLEIMRFSSDGTDRGDMADAVIERQGNTLQISFADSADTITINLTGRMAEAESLQFVYKSGTQSLLIADDQFFVDNPPGQTVFVWPEATK